jgi:hypothetical protein
LTSNYKTNERRVNENHLRVVIGGRSTIGRTILLLLLLAWGRKRVASLWGAGALSAVAACAASLITALVSVRVVAVTSGFTALGRARP